MPYNYNPGVGYDTSSVGAGIGQGLSMLANQIQANRAQREAKEREKKAREAVQAAGAALFGEQFDLKDAPQESWGSIIQIAQAKQQAPVRALELENAQLRARITAKELEQRGIDALAQQEAARYLRPQLPDAAAVAGAYARGQPVPTTGAADPTAALQTYMQRGGMDAQTLSQLGALAQQEAQQRGKGGTERRPAGLVNFGTDSYGRPVEGLVDAQGNVSRIAPPADPRETARPFEIGGKQFYQVGSTIMDAEGKPVKAESGPKELDPTAAQRVLSDYQLAMASAQQAEEEAANAWTDRGRKEAEAKAKNSKERANMLAQRLGYATPFPEAASPGQPAADPASPATAVAEQPSPQRKGRASPYTTAELSQELARRGLR